MPESAAKRKFCMNQTTASCSALGCAGVGGVIRPAGKAHSRARSRLQATLSDGSAPSSENTAPDSTAASWSLDDARRLGHGLQQPGGQRQVEHRGLVYHQRIDRQRIACVVHKAAGGRRHAEQAVDRAP